MTTRRICPCCQKPIPLDAPMGLCPQCLIKSGFHSSARATFGGTNARRAAGSVPVSALLRKPEPRLQQAEESKTRVERTAGGSVEQTMTGTETRSD